MRYWLLPLAIAAIFCSCTTPSPQLTHAQLVQASFREAWVNETIDKTSPEAFHVEARIVVARDGEVRSAIITQSSGDPELDRLVQTTLNRVKNVAPFPKGVVEEQRTFVLHFQIKSKS